MNVTNYKVYNKTLVLDNTEYSQQMTERASYFEVKVRSLTAELKVAFVAGGSGTTYFTIPAGSTWYTKGVVAGQKTLYFQSPQAGTVVEIIEAF